MLVRSQGYLADAGLAGHMPGIVVSGETEPLAKDPHENQADAQIEENQSGPESPLPQTQHAARADL